MTRKQFAISTGLVAVLWIAVYVVGVMWVTDGVGLPDAGSKMVTAYFGVIIIGFATAVTMSVVKWVINDPS